MNSTRQNNSSKTQALNNKTTFVLLVVGIFFASIAHAEPGPNDPFSSLNNEDITIPSKLNFPANSYFITLQDGKRVVSPDRNRPYCQIVLKQATDYDRELEPRTLQITGTSVEDMNNQKWYCGWHEMQEGDGCNDPTRIDGTVTAEFQTGNDSAVDRVVCGEWKGFVDGSFGGLDAIASKNLTVKNISDALTRSGLSLTYVAPVKISYDPGKNGTLEFPFYGNSDRSLSNAARKKTEESLDSNGFDVEKAAYVGQIR